MKKIVFGLMALFIACSSHDENDSAGNGSPNPLEDSENVLVSDITNSGCLTRSRSNSNQESRSIVLKKEGDIITCEFRNFQSNCSVRDFNVNTNVLTAQDKVDTLMINVTRVTEKDELSTCICPFNISFVIRNVDANDYYLQCWFYKGAVSFKQGDTLVLEDNTNSIP